MYVFTTRADTIMGVTFCAVAAEHPLATNAAKSNPALAAFIDDCRHGSVIEADLATMEKKGMNTGLFVTHPLTGEPIELWVGNYVLMTYGDGAVMGVPAHDERDFAFAKKYGLPIKQVIAVPGEEFLIDLWQPWYADKERGRCVFSIKYDDLAYAEAVEAIAADLSAKGLGEKRITYRLRDWSVSRQRYWGTPIPIIHCAGCGPVPVPERDLPVVLPEDCVPDGGGNPLNKREDFLNVACPKCGKPARRETDTLDTFVDSSWYYMRYTSPGAATMVDARNDYWMPMDQYIGGIEHAILHLLYARFWTKVMRDMGLVKVDEPFTRLFTQGMLLNHIYFRRNAKGGKEYHSPDSVTPTTDAQGHITGGRLSDGTLVEYGGVGKMGKTEQNGVEPQDLIDKYGADTARLYVMFAGSPDDSAIWSDAGVDGAHRFLKRMWAFGQAHADAVRSATGRFDFRDADEAVKAARRELHMTLKQANYDYERIQYNTVVSAGMKMLNALEAVPPGSARRRCAGARGPVDPAAHALSGRAARHLCAVAGPRAGRRVRRTARRAVAGRRCRGARTGRDRTRAAGERQAARQAQRSGCRGQAGHRGRRAGERRGGEARQWRAGEEGHHRARPARERGRLMRRIFLRLTVALIALSALWLGGCGFHLRGAANYTFESVYLNSAAPPPFTNEMKRALTGAGSATLTDTAVAAQVVLDIPVVQDDKEVLSLSSGGSVREYQLIKRVSFRLHDKDGADWMPAGEIVIRRAYTFNETQVLARDLEEQRLQKDMQTDAIQQIVRRLQAAKKPA